MGDYTQNYGREVVSPIVPIAAVATAAGRGAIGVLRVSGADLAELARTLTGRSLTPRHASYGPFLDADGQAIDHGLALYFPAPHSYTGEDVLELQGHGGPVVMQLLLDRVLHAGQPLGVRLANPGEFTERAFLNDKLDLAQAEAVADLIDANSAQAARSATRSLAGVFSQRILALIELLTNLRMLVESTLDFPEEEIDFLEQADAQGQLTTIRGDLTSMLANASQGALLRDGLQVVIAGPPNVGKSSLLNELTGDDIAIVTPIAGTTRDKISQSIQIDGVPLNIIDTAGLRATDDEVEQIGIERAREQIRQADVLLMLRDQIAQTTPTKVDAEAIELARESGASIVNLLNKTDRLGLSAGFAEDGLLRISAKTGDGIALLKQRLLEIAGWQGASEDQFIARERHVQALKVAQLHLDTAAQCEWQSLDLLAEELRLAQLQLGQITGAVSADDLLGVIFSRFCIGK